MGFSREESAGYIANLMARLLARHLAEAIRPLGIVPGQFPILLELWDRDGRTQSELVELLAVEQATMANTLARMERDGLISRVADGRDNRVRRIFLTEKARTVEGPAKQAANAVNARALAGLDQTEIGRFLETMRRVVANLDEDGVARG